MAKDIEDFGNALNRLKEQLKEIKGSITEEAEDGNAYTLKHIQQLNSSDRMVGTQGLRLKVQLLHSTYKSGTFYWDRLTKCYFNNND